MKRQKRRKDAAEWREKRDRKRWGGNTMNLGRGTSHEKRETN